MLSIDEAIAFCYEKSNNIKLKAEPEVLVQLAEWLEELKDYRDKNKMVVRVDCENMDSIKDKIEELSKYAESQYNKAIDDFAGRLIRYVDCGHLCSPTEMRWSDLSVVEMVKKLAEQLKAGV